MMIKILNKNRKEVTSYEIILTITPPSPSDSLIEVKLEIEVSRRNKLKLGSKVIVIIDKEYLFMVFSIITTDNYKTITLRPTFKDKQLYG